MKHGNINWQTTRLLADKKFKHKLSDEEREKREVLKAEIAALSTSVSEADKEAMRERIKGRQRWSGMGG